MAKIDWNLNDTVRPADMNQIGTEINQLRTDVDNIEVPDGTTLQKGIVQLSNSTSGSSQMLAATEKAVSDALAQAKAYVDQENLWGAL
ncbi:phage tail protein [Paenibacillus polysaccharolyticus]|uniref:phage tail protein n=1 Tax=Paenibacillus polysaccharolyticus TaxID=582692 RepID=UPI0020406A78|nr:phage tail protein [Paenibacillus polysaccharolyticus]MCM3131913.1 phage tail protein [Paenibacillus polysaccharolyticus]